MEGQLEKRQVISEYAAEGSISPMVMLRKGNHKLVVCPADPDQLFDLESDPCESINLATNSDHAEIHADMKASIDSSYDFEGFTQNVLTSQKHRLLVYDALRNGNYYPWDYQPLQQASERYMRNHKDLNVLEGDARYPRFSENKT